MTAPNRVSFRSLCSADLPGLMDLYDEVFGSLDPLYSYPIDAARFEDRVLRHPDYDPRGSIVAEEGGRIVGYALGGVRTHRVLPSDPLEGCILCLLMVAPDRRRRGIGHALLERVLSFGRSFGRLRVTNHPNPASPFSFFNGVQEGWAEAEAFFAAEGFRRTGRSCTCRLYLETHRMPERTEVRLRELRGEGCRIEPCSETTAPMLLEAAASASFYWWLDCRSKVERIPFPFLETTFLSLPGEAIHGPGDVTILHREGRVESYVVMARDPAARIAYLGPMWTHPERRRLGLGSVVIQEALRREREEFGTRIVDLWCGEANARGFYAANGFRIVRRWTEWEREI